MHLSPYNYTCIHIKGHIIVWEDFLGRWSTLAVLRQLIYVPILTPSSSGSFVWPSLFELKTEETKFANSRPPNIEMFDGLWKDSSLAVWIPGAAHDLQLRLCIIVHMEPGGHRGSKATDHSLCNHFFWNTVKEDAPALVRSSIHCLSTLVGRKVPRPFSPAFHGTAMNDLLQFGYIEISPSTSGEKYILIMREDHSDYMWFYACHYLTSETAPQAIIDWCAAFSVLKSLMSDGPALFKNEIIRLVSRGLRFTHHFTLPYTA